MNKLGNCEITAHQIKEAIDTAESITGNTFSPEELKPLLSRIGSPTRSKMDYVNSYIINSMLSGLASTGFANVMSMGIKMAHALVDDVVESGIKKLRGADRFTLGEIVAAYKTAAMHSGIMFNMGRKGFQKGYPLDIDVSVSQMAAATNQSRKEVVKDLRKGLIDMQVNKLVKERGMNANAARTAAEAAFKNERDVMEAVQDMFNDKYDYMQNVFRDFEDSEAPLAKYLKYINVPTQATVAIDEFGKSFFRMYAANKMLAKQAVKESSAKGVPFSDIFNGYVEAMTKNKAGKKFSDLGEEFSDREYLSNFRQTLEKITNDTASYEKVKEYALREMFQSRLTGSPRGVQEFVNANSSRGMRLVVPFIKTPWNIAKHTITYTPAGYVIKKMAGKAQTKLVNGQEVIDTRNMGAFYDFTEDELLARAAVGMGIMGSIAMLVDSDSITGSPRDAREAQQWRDQGIPEKAIKIGDSWIPYGRIEPLATAFGLVAEMERIYDDYNSGREDWKSTDKLLGNTAKALKDHVLTKTFLESFSGIMEAATSTQGTAGERFVSGLLRPTVPTIVAQGARAMDTTERQAGQGGDMVSRVKERMMQRIPFVREMLPEEYGLYGSRGEPTIAETFLSFKVTNEGDLSPVQKLAREVGIDKIRPSADLRNLGISSEQLAEYRKATAISVERALAPLASDPTFNSLPKARQRKIAETIVDRAKKAPRNKMLATLLRTDPELARRFRENQMRKAGMIE